MKHLECVAFLFALAAGLASCASGPGRLYEDRDPPVLKDGSARLFTRWDPRDEERDQRAIVCRDGVVTAELRTSTRGHRRGAVPQAAWVDLWKKLLPALDDGSLAVASEAAQGSGPYHVVELVLGGEQRRFSAQLRRNVLGVFATRDVAAGLEYSDAIAEVVSKYATEPVATEGGAP